MVPARRLGWVVRMRMEKTQNIKSEASGLFLAREHICARHLVAVGLLIGRPGVGQGQRGRGGLVGSIHRPQQEADPFVGVGSLAVGLDCA